MVVVVVGIYGEWGEQYLMEEILEVVWTKISSLS
jgi:hypothetical protein